MNARSSVLSSFPEFVLVLGSIGRSEMEAPTALDNCLMILILRTAGCTQDSVASMVHRAKQTVGAVESWFTQLHWQEARALCEDRAIKEMVGRELVSIEDVDPETLVKAAQLTGDSILRHFRPDYTDRVARDGLDQARLLIQFDPARLTDLGSYRDDKGRRALYCTANMSSDGPAAARRCFGFLSILSPEIVLSRLPRNFKLHVAGTSTSLEDDVVEPVDIPPHGNRRLDVLFAPLPEHYAGKGTTSGDVVGIKVDQYAGSLPESASSSQVIVEGCWVATPQALRNPNRCNQAYLAQGKYTALVWVTCDNLLGETPTLRLEIMSPGVGEQLVVTPVPQGGL